MMRKRSKQPPPMLNKEQIKLIFQNFPTTKWVLLSMMVSGGFSLTDVLDMERKNVDFTSDPTRITLMRKMSGFVYVTFISKEATILLKQHIVTTNIVRDDDKLFTWKPRLILNLWRKALEKSKLEKMPIFTLRKFFYMNTMIEHPLYASLLTGHKIPEMRLPEFQVDVPALERLYRKIESQVSDFL